ncbi:MAG: DUF4258 domain-containing protein [Thermoanaerobacteraceae bacterium]|nr:DUF4258 domain-containing protein [Thermoanaerobacteraceae bacterium]
MNDMAEQWIRKCVKNGLLDYSSHAICRMIERQIEDKKIIECILYGKVVELQPQFKDIHVIFQEATDKDPEIYTVVAAAYPYPLVVTVCRTIEEVWECYNGLLKRREKK